MRAYLKHIERVKQRQRRAVAKCQHQNGVLVEWMDATHSREVQGGVLEEEGENNIGNITHYMFDCYDCGRTFRFSPPCSRRWQTRLLEQLA